MPNSLELNRAPGGRAGFSLIEILLVTVLLSLIMLALMSVFNTTQNAFRASITQTDVLEGSRATMDLISGDLRQMYPSGGSNAFLAFPNSEPYFLAGGYNPPSAPLNFYLSSPISTIAQSLIGVSNGQLRTNQVQSFFILSRQNDIWRGVGYVVDPNSDKYIFPLYRYDSFGSSILPARPTAFQLFTNFLYVTTLSPVQKNLDFSTNVNHLLDGVLHLNLRAYGTNGVWLTNGYGRGQSVVVQNARFFPPASGEVAMYMCSNTLPASVEIQMAVMEDRSLQRASSMPMNSVVQSNYLAQQVGKLHLFRQRVTIPNVDPAAYQ